MDTTAITVDREEARVLFRKCHKHQHYSTPINWQIQRTYQLMAQGRVVVKAIESIITAGLSLPKLALVRADSKLCFWRPHNTP
jgi:hypothetical protein